MAKMTLFGMNQYKSKDLGLFDLVELPEGIDRELVINNILIKGGEYEVLYADWDFLRFQLGVIAKKWAPTFEKWLEGFNATYNPLENYDRYEEYSDIEKTAGKSSSTDSSVGASSSNSQSDTSAFDGGMTPKDQMHESGSNNTNTSSNSDTESDRHLDHTAHLHGNIGVTTAAQMLEGHYAISSWNLVEHITDVFLREIIIPIL